MIDTMCVKLRLHFPRTKQLLSASALFLGLRKIEFLIQICFKLCLKYVKRLFLCTNCVFSMLINLLEIRESLTKEVQKKCMCKRGSRVYDFSYILTL